MKFPIDFWDERYEQKDFVYGKKPNEFFKKTIANFSPGKILLPADGEGRNGVYAALSSWEVHAFDLSKQAIKKAMILADENDVSFEDYRQADAGLVEYPNSFFDAIAFIYSHFPGNRKEHIIKGLLRALKPGGMVILELFSKAQLDDEFTYRLGPKDKKMLFSKKEIIKIFDHFEVEHLSETEIDLNEGDFHKGKGIVIRFIGRKN